MHVGTVYCTVCLLNVCCVMVLIEKMCGKGLRRTSGSVTVICVIFGIVYLRFNMRGDQISQLFGGWVRFSIGPFISGDIREALNVGVSEGGGG